jgi:hypothetical protein
MVRKSLPTSLFAFALAALLAGCAANGPRSSGGADFGATGSDSSANSPLSQSGAADCDAQPVQGLLGQVYSDNVGETIRQNSGSKSIRLLKYNEMMTMEYIPSRINIIVDAKGAIYALRCG